MTARRWLVLGGCSRRRSRSGARSRLRTAPAAAEEAATWRLEQPSPPPPPPGVPAPPAAVALGKVGDIEFWEPPGEAPQANRGLLITHGNGYAVPARRVGLRRQRLARDLQRPAARAMGASRGAGRATSGRSPTSGRGRRRSRACSRRWRTARCATSPAARSSRHTRAWPSNRTPMRRCRAQSACPRSRPRRARRTAGLAGKRSRRTAGRLVSPALERRHARSAAIHGTQRSGGGNARARKRDLRERRLQQRRRSATNRRRLRGRLCCTSPKRKLRWRRSAKSCRSTAVSSNPPKRSNTCAWARAEGVLWAAAGNHPEQPGVPEDEEGQVSVLRRVDGVWTQVFGFGEAGGSAHPLPKLFESGLLESEQEEENCSVRPGRARTAAMPPKRKCGRSRPNRAAKTPGSRSRRTSTANTKATATAVLVHISAHGEVLGVQTLPSKAERELPERRRGRRRAARVPRARRLLDGELQRLAVSPRPRRRTHAPARRTAGLP